MTNNGAKMTHGLSHQGTGDGPIATAQRATAKARRTNTSADHTAAEAAHMACKALPNMDKAGADYHLMMACEHYHGALSAKAKGL